MEKEKSMSLALSNGPMAITDPAIAAASEAVKARIQAAYIMAYQKPRDEDQARQKILRACKRPEFAERVEFSKPVGNTKIRGASIRFAELAVREWQNCMVDTQVVYEDDKIRRTRVSVLDLETNSQYNKEFAITKTVERKNKKGREVLGERLNTWGDTVFIVKATDEELMNKESAMISKAIRTEGLRLIPVDIIDESIATARETLRNRDAEDPDASKKRVLDAFADLNIMPNKIAAYLGHDLNTIVTAELEQLRTMFETIRSGESTWQSYVDLKDGNGPEPQKINTSKFDEQLPEAVPGTLDEFVKVTALANDMSVDVLKVAAAEDFDGFWKGFEGWRKEQKPEETEPPKIPCEICKQMCMPGKGMKRHMSMQHPEPPPETDPKKERQNMIDEMSRKGFKEWTNQAMESLGISDSHALEDIDQVILDKIHTKFLELKEAGLKEQCSNN